MDLDLGDGFGREKLLFCNFKTMLLVSNSHFLNDPNYCARAVSNNLTSLIRKLLKCNCNKYTSKFSAVFTKGNYLSDFLFASLNGETLSKCGLLGKEKEFDSKGANSFLLISDPYRIGRQNENWQSCFP